MKQNYATIRNQLKYKFKIKDLVKPKYILGVQAKSAKNEIALFTSHHLAKMSEILFSRQETRSEIKFKEFLQLLDQEFISHFYQNSIRSLKQVASLIVLGISCARALEFRELDHHIKKPNRNKFCTLLDGITSVGKPSRSF
jgi:hypothetical protein